MSGESLELVRRNIDVIGERIGEACRRCGRDRGEVTLMAVTKTRSKAEVDAAFSAGITVFGENRIQEAEMKFGRAVEEGTFYTGSELHLIGHLQSNKAKNAAGLFSWVQSIEKTKTASVLDRYCAEKNKTMNILLEMNTSGEESKFGYPSAEPMYRDLETIGKMENLRLRGLMTVGPFTADEDRIRRAFENLRKEFESLRERYPEFQVDTLSMGMSGDFELAVEEGATMVRIGTTIFGPRQ